MSNEEILEKAISKAIDGGWKRPSWAPNISVESLARDSLDGIPYWQSFVYSRDFAKALWPEPGTIDECINRMNGGFLPTWKYHLKRMVTSSDPIKYLGKYVSG